jgi:hypothetical protein
MQTGLTREPYSTPGKMEILRAFGSFTTSAGSEQTTWLHLEHKKFDVSKITCRLFFPQPWKDSHIIPDTHDRNLEIRIESPFQGKLKLQMIGSGRYDENEASFDINGYDLLPLEMILRRGDRIIIAADLVRSRLIGSHGDLSVKWGRDEWKIAGDKRPGFSWACDEAEYKFIARPMLEKISVDKEECYITRTRPCLAKVFIAPEDIDILSAMDQAENDFSDILRLLSFLSREWVDWFELSAETTSTNEIYYSARAIRRVQIRRKNKGDDYEPPILDKTELSNETFAKLLRSLRALPQADVLSRTMAYGLSSREGEYIDSNFILAFSALETIINNLDDQSPLLQPKEISWNTLRKSLKDCIDKHGESKKLPARQMSFIKNKLGELERPPIRDKINFHASRCGVKTSDLWMHPITGESQFQEGLERAIRQRNDLVHATSVRDLGDLQNDLVRIQLLFERFVLRLLDYCGDVSCRAIYDI